ATAAAESGDEVDPDSTAAAESGDEVDPDSTAAISRTAIKAAIEAAERADKERADKQRAEDAAKATGTSTATGDDKPTGNAAAEASKDDTPAKDAAKPTGTSTATGDDKPTGNAADEDDGESTAVIPKIVLREEGKTGGQGQGAGAASSAASQVQSFPVQKPAA